MSNRPSGRITPTRLHKTRRNGPPCRPSRRSRTGSKRRTSATTHPSHRESAHITAAKRRVPLLCAFTGARVTEITQLRKQDVFKEAGRWMLRITPEAGSVKTGEYRDAPLHRQVVEPGFLEFVKGANEGPLFHGAQTPEKYLSGARTTSGRLSQWLHKLNLVPENVQPNYGWRHRFKTQGRELGMSKSPAQIRWPCSSISEP